SSRCASRAGTWWSRSWTVDSSPPSPRHLTGDPARVGVEVVLVRRRKENARALVGELRTGHVEHEALARLAHGLVRVPDESRHRDRTAAARRRVDVEAPPDRVQGVVEGLDGLTVLGRETRICELLDGPPHDHASSGRTNSRGSPSRSMSLVRITRHG